MIGPTARDERTYKANTFSWPDFCHYVSLQSYWNSLSFHYCCGTYQIVQTKLGQPYNSDIDTNLLSNLLTPEYINNIWHHWSQFACLLVVRGVNRNSSHNQPVGKGHLWFWQTSRIQFNKFILIIIIFLYPPAISSLASRWKSTIFSPQQWSSHDISNIF